MPAAVRFAALALVASCGRIGFDQEGPVSRGTANRAFVTETQLPVTALVDPDRICAQHAMAAGLDGAFVAWLATTASPFERLVGSRGWRRVDDVAIADDPSDFVTRSILAPVAVDASGNDVRDTVPLVWTGLAGDGTVGVNCTAWTDTAAASVGAQGSTRSNEITRAIASPCDGTAGLLCLEVGHVATVAIERAAARLAFVSASVFVVGGGIAAADALCAAEAASAHLAGSFKAMLPPAGMTSAQRFDLARPPWARVDGALLAPTAQALFTAPYLDTFLDRTADGTPIVATMVWGGRIDSPPLATCSGWTDPTAPSASIGNPLTTLATGFFNGSSAGCSNANQHLVCLQD
jgi:hypothetical protein